MRRLCSVSVDLDPLGCYYAIHGIAQGGAFASPLRAKTGRVSPRDHAPSITALPEDLADVVLRRAVPRFAELFGARGLRATFFVVGRDLDAELGRRAIAALSRDGHEIGNHSQSHHYDLARRDAEDVDGEIGAAHERIARITGKAPVGFRAPGYDVAPSVLAALERRGYLYDSSVFSSPPYYLAKALVFARMALEGRRSASVMTDPRALFAPTDPYRPSSRAPFRRGGASLVELPIAVSPLLRVPAIGTSIAVLPTWARVRLLESMRRRPFFNLELHGLDLLDADDDGLPLELVARQADLRVPLIKRRRALCATLDRLAAEYQLVPLCEAAAAVAQREGKREAA